jgi:Pvc16 N-terminal domain
MSNSLAIATVTTTLQRLLIQGIIDLPGVSVTVKPPDKAFGGGAAAIDQINIFLYQTTPNAAWRNRDIPNQVRPGETSQQPLALSLHYLITASGAGDDDIKSHQWLGKAMSIFHDHWILSRQEIANTIAALGDSKLQEQLERVRITPLSLSIEDLSKLWTTFTTPYRLSAAYEVSVVLIESTRPARSPLPVLDRSISVQPNFLPPFPTLTQIDIPNAQDVARSGDGSLNSGDVITLQGYQLQPEAGETPEINLLHPRRLEPLQPSILEDSSSATQIVFRLPDNPDPTPVASDPLTDPNQWLVGVYRITVAISRIRQLPDGSSNRETRLTNELSLAIAPRITSPPIYTAANRNLRITCSPRILPSQRTVLLLGDHQLISTHSTATNTLDFILPSTVLAGDYFVRLRVDGIDSLLVVRQGTPAKLAFDPGQKVTVS